MKTQEDLYLEYARCITMTRDYNEKHLTDVKPWECVRTNTGYVFRNHPQFNNNRVDNYTFALAILEGKPVFVGNKFYHVSPNSNDGTSGEWVLHGFDDIGNITFSNNKIKVVADKIGIYFTWTPPTTKRTFMLNGVELPCPVENGNFILNVYGMGRYKFSFESEHDMRIVGDHLSDLLTEARNKE